MESFTAPFTVLRLLTPLNMSYEAAKKRAEPYNKIVGELQEMRRETVDFVKKAFTGNRRAYVIVNNRSEGNVNGRSPSAPLIKPLARNELKQRYLAFVEHQRGLATKEIHFAHFARVWGNPLIHTLAVEVLNQYRALRLSEKSVCAILNREMATLKHALDKAFDWKVLRETAREELTAIRRYQEPDGRLPYLSGQAKAERLLQAWRRTSKGWRLILNGWLKNSYGTSVLSG